MRPKTVVIAIILGVAALAALIIAKSLVRPDSTTASTTAPVVEPAVSNPVVVSTRPANSGVIAMTPQQEAAARIEQAMDEIREDLANNRPLNLLGKLNSQDQQVRLEAVDALKALDYTNGIPQLVAAMNAATDIKEKAAIQEAIDFLQLPVGNPTEELKAIQAMEKAQLQKPSPKPAPTNAHGLPGVQLPSAPVKRQPLSPPTPNP